MQIKFKNGSTLDCNIVLGERRYIRGSNRDALTFVFDEGAYENDVLYKSFTDEENTAEITIIDEEKECLHKGYSLFVSLEVTDDVTEKESHDAPEVLKRVVKVTMGQKTYTEEQADAQRAEINALNEVMADVIGGVY